MTAQEREAVLEGIKAARRLHAELGTRRAVEDGALSRIDVFSVAAQLGAVLLFQKLGGLLGAYLAAPVSPVPGIIVSTERSLHIQRFTAAHEVGHLYMKHAPATDEEVGLWRGGSRDLQEFSADAFASEFLLPQWLYEHHARRHKWTSAALQSPDTTYQLSLRLGASYEAVCWGLESHNILKPGPVAELRAVTPKEIKTRTLDGRAKLQDAWADVWVINEKDDGLAFEGTPNDIVIFQLAERAAAGYLWDETQLRERGFDVIADTHEEQSGDEVGSSVTRVMITRVIDPDLRRVSLSERRPWLPSDTAGSVSIDFEMHGKEEGLPRHLRRSIAAA